MIDLRDKTRSAILAEFVILGVALLLMVGGMVASILMGEPQ